MIVRFIKKNALNIAKIEKKMLNNMFNTCGRLLALGSSEKPSGYFRTVENYITNRYCFLCV